MDPEEDDTLFDDEYTLETTALESAELGLSAKVDLLASPRGELQQQQPSPEVSEMATLYKQMLVKKAAQIELMRKKETHVAGKHKAALKQRDTELEELRLCFGKAQPPAEISHAAAIRKIRECIVGLRAALSSLTATVRQKEGLVAHDMKTSLTVFSRRFGRCLVVDDSRDEDASVSGPSYQAQVEAMLAKLAPPPEEEEEEEAEGVVKEVVTTAQHRADGVLASLKRMLTAKEQSDWLAARERELAGSTVLSPPSSPKAAPPPPPKTFAEASTETTPVYFSSPRKDGDGPVPLPRPTALEAMTSTPRVHNELDDTVVRLLRKAGHTHAATAGYPMTLAARAEQVVSLMGGPNEISVAAAKVQHDTVIARLREIADRLKAERADEVLRTLYNVRGHNKPTTTHHVYCHKCGKGPFPSIRTFRCDACATRLVRVVGNNATINKKDQARYEYFFRKNEERRMRKEEDMEKKKTVLRLEREGVYRHLIDYLAKKSAQQRMAPLVHTTSRFTVTPLTGLLRPVPGITTTEEAPRVRGIPDSLLHRPRHVKNPLHLREMPYHHNHRVTTAQTPGWGPWSGLPKGRAPPIPLLPEETVTTHSPVPFVLPSVVGTNRVPGYQRHPRPK